MGANVFQRLDKQPLQRNSGGFVDVFRCASAVSVALVLVSSPGFADAAELGDFVWEDVDADGIQDGSEYGVAGASVVLHDCATGNVVGNTTTDSGGAYAFTGLAAGNYRVQFVAPTGFEFSPERQGSSRGFDSDPDPLTGFSSCRSLTDTKVRAGIDAGLVPTGPPPPPPPPPSGGPGLNVLFISVDDLRPELGAYGAYAINTPSIDALAQEGVTFTRAYTQMSTCSPSRTSYMTGLRPDTTQVTNLKTHFRDTIPTVVTLPEYFKQYGYHTEGICKVYHNKLDDSQSWTVPYKDAYGPGAPRGTDGKRLPFAAVDVAESKFADHGCATLAIDAIESAKDGPFFIAVGFKKPHLPFLAPPAYFDMYDKNAIPMATNPFRAAGAPSLAFENWSELRDYSGIPPAGQSFDEGLRRDLKRGYYASTSFVDAQVGRVLAALDAAGVSDKTIVVFLGDHGFHLGEQDDWGKHTNFEIGTRVPLIIRVPDGTANQTTDAVVELVDLYPTIVELAGLAVPSAQQHGGYPLEGDSLAGFIDDPAAASSRGAFSQWRRSGYVGHSIRTDRYRYTEWVRGGNRIVELYDHALDPDETVNVVSQAQYSSVVTLLSDALAAGGQQDLPAELR